MTEEISDWIFRNTEAVMYFFWEDVSQEWRGLVSRGVGDASTYSVCFLRKVICQILLKTNPGEMK
jgi:hypothetical protein